MKVRQQLLACDAALAAMTWTYLAFAYTAFGHQVYEIRVCPWLLVTGNPCPLCGSTHFIGALLHGDVAIDRVSMAWILWLIVIVCVGILSSVRTVIGFQSHRPDVMLATSRS